MKKLLLSLLIILSLIPFSFADEFETQITEEDKTTFDNILKPISKIYTFVKYAATTVAALYLIFVGLNFIMAGNDQNKRESAKTQAGYIVAGLIIIWVAPIVVQYLTS